MLPEPDRSVGGHATAGYGWNDLIEVPWDGSMGAFRVANSWGEEYGDDGDFWLPYSVFGPGKAADEAWKPVDLIT
jgi:C1A family cysteine protease